MPRRSVVVIGASAGGIEALRELLKPLPQTFDAAILIVLHTSSHASSLAAILQRATELPVSYAQDWEPIEKAHVYIAPPDFHLIVEGNLLRVIQGPRENLHRPAIDPLFRSAAVAFGQRLIGVVLTGLLDDGTAGLMVIHAQGGETIVQDPKTALFSPMPANALKQVPQAHVSPLAEIPGLLMELIEENLPDLSHGASPEPLRPEKETRLSELNMSEMQNSEQHVGRPSVFGCPECGGVLWEIEDHDFLRFRCRVGHAYTALHLEAEQRHTIETALWAALRALEESASLYRRLTSKSHAAGHGLSADKFSERAETTETNAKVLRDFLLRVNQPEEEGSLVSEDFS